MTYYNPEVYNYEALKGEDKFVVNILREAAKDLDNVVEIAFDDETTLEKITREIREECVEECKERLDMFINEFIVAAIDGYGE